jgi:hypothetical protein
LIWPFVTQSHIYQEREFYSMHANRQLRRAGLLAATTALAALGSSSAALATTPIYGSGAAVQKSIQSTWITDSSSSVTYTSTNSGDGFAEFGNFTASLNPAEDTTADPQLDAYVAVDNPPTGSGSGTNLYDAAEAAYGTPVSIPPGEVTVPVAQTPLALLISLPNDLSIPANQSISLGNVLAAEAYAGTVPASTDYSKGTWGALLEDAKWTRITSGTPTGKEFLESGSSSAKTGGYSLIEDEVRTAGAGATLTLKQYFAYVDSTDWGSITIDENTSGTGEWPTGITIAGSNSSDSAEALETALTPGTLGYATLASATASADGGFTNGGAVGTESGAGTNQILYALLQDNGTGTSSVQYADPELGTGTEANVYTGTNINTSGTFAPGTQTGVGEWNIPTSSGSEVPTGAWATSTTNPSDYSHNWDPDVYVDAGATNTKKYYPLTVTLWDLGWSAYDSGNLISAYTHTGDLGPTATGNAAQTYLEYVTDSGSSTSTSGQYAAETASSYYAELPTGVQPYAYEAAQGIN